MGPFPEARRRGTVSARADECAYCDGHMFVEMLVMLLVLIRLLSYRCGCVEICWVVVVV